MKLVELHIARKQAEFAKHPFFAQLKLGLGTEEALTFAPDLTFWVMAFQDILRLNVQLTRDTEIRRIVRHHRAEDAGHEAWFLDDLEIMNVAAPDVRWIFGKRHSPTRDAAYALVSEVFRAADDRLRLVLVKTLESAGHIFFERVSSVVGRERGAAMGLKYFSFSHLEVEKSHEVFEREMAERVSSIQLSPSARAEAEHLVDRCYGAFGAMFDALSAPEYREMSDLPTLPSGVRQARARTQR